MIAVLVLAAALLFPKAGFPVGEVPIALAFVALSCWSAFRFLMLSVGSRVGIRWAAAFWFGAGAILLSSVYNASGLSIFGATATLVLLTGPMGVAFTPNRQRSVLRLVKVTAWAVILVSTYALAQRVFGVENLVVDGLTTLRGEDVIADNPITTRSGVLKSPATYQNGNLFAGFLLSAVPLVGLAYRRQLVSRQLAYVCFSLGALGVATSLARSAVVAIFLLLLVIARPSRVSASSFRARRALTVILPLITLILIAGISSSNFVTQRYFGDIQADTSGSGRTDQVGQSFSALLEGDLLAVLGRIVFGLGWAYDGGTEGLLTLFVRWGGLTVVAVLFLVHATWRSLRPLGGSWPMALALLVPLQSIADNVMVFPPVYLTYFVMVGLARSLPEARSLVNEAGELAEHGFQRLA